MRRATKHLCLPVTYDIISIHALLAESDGCLCSQDRDDRDFYPRSPCGERRTRPIVVIGGGDFYPRSPCGERPTNAGRNGLWPKFLSTLSLRRATQDQWLCEPVRHISIHALLAESDLPIGYVTSHWFQFLSTLSLRRATSGLYKAVHESGISIHALLAESDHVDGVISYRKIISIHALLAESDGQEWQHCQRYAISIHALLAESDSWRP